MREADFVSCRKLLAILEEYKNSIRNMALNGGEGIAAMGVDTPLAVLSEKQRPLSITSSSCSLR